MKTFYILTAKSKVPVEGMCIHDEFIKARNPQSGHTELLRRIKLLAEQGFTRFEVHAPHGELLEIRGDGAR